MNLQKHTAAYFLSATLVCCVGWTPAGWAQDSGSSVSMVTLKTAQGANGQQMVISPGGQELPLPGAGVNGNSIEIYMGSQGGYWYTDRNGNNFDLTPYVQQLRVSQPQYGNGQGYNNNSGSNSGSSSGNSSGSNSSSNNGETAVAAGAGAMVGAAAGTAYSNYQNENSGYSVPYGAAVSAAGGRAYYAGANGNTVYVNNSQSANVNTANLQAQQKWYDQQKVQNTQGFQNWQQNTPKENPFVAKGASPASGSGEGGGHRGGPFGGGGGPFGHKGGQGGEPTAGSEGGPGGGGGPFGHRGGQGGEPSLGGEGAPGGGGPFAGKGAPSGGGPFAGKSVPSGGGPFAGGGAPKGRLPLGGGGGIPRMP